MLPIQMDVEISIRFSKGNQRKKLSSYYLTIQGRLLTTCINTIFWGGKSWVLPMYIVRISMVFTDFYARRIQYKDNDSNYPILKLYNSRFLALK